MDLIRQPKVENVKMYDRLTSCVTSGLTKNSSTGQSTSSSISTPNSSSVGVGGGSSTSSIASSQLVNQYPLTCGLTGTLYVTATHLIFVDIEGRSETWLLHSHIASVDKLPISTQGTPLLIKCKNFQVITFILPKSKDAHEVSNSLYQLSRPVSYEDLYCFRYSASNEPFKNQRSKTWSKFDLLREFKRQGVPNKYWLVSNLNVGYQLCETYPRHLLVPAKSNESMLKSSASFRSKCRLPVLTYRYTNDACICRCSQPLSGFSQRCEEDESLLNAILWSNCNSKVLYVVDTRPRVSAFLCYSWNQAVNVMLPELSRKIIKLSTSATPSATTSCYCSSSTSNSELSNYSLYPFNPSHLTADSCDAAKCQDTSEEDADGKSIVPSIIPSSDDNYPPAVSSHNLINDSDDINYVSNKPLTHLTQDEKSFNDASDLQEHQMQCLIQSKQHPQQQQLQHPAVQSKQWHILQWPRQFKLPQSASPLVDAAAFNCEKVKTSSSSKSKNVTTATSASDQTIINDSSSFATATVTCSTNPHSATSSSSSSSASYLKKIILNSVAGYGRKNTRQTYSLPITPVDASPSNSSCTSPSPTTQFVPSLLMQQHQNGSNSNLLNLSLTQNIAADSDATAAVNYTSYSSDSDTCTSRRRTGCSDVVRDVDVTSTSVLSNSNSSSSNTFNRNPINFGNFSNAAAALPTLRLGSLSTHNPTFNLNSNSNGNCNSPNSGGSGKARAPGPGREFDAANDDETTHNLNCLNSLNSNNVASSSSPLSTCKSKAKRSFKTNRKYSSYLTPHKKMNAYANKAAGKGYENESFYENIKFNFFAIENIHVMRSSLAKLLEASELFHVSPDAFITALESSGWLKHLKSVLEAASFVARAITDGISVVVHCSDGWDRTAQTCSLAALLIDPYYRTINGFQALIEKEWIAFGHKFSERCGHIQIGDAKEIAPVFTQFVDCVWQIQLQHPCEFEFNEKFLILLHDHVYSCQFGNFIGNCDRDRTDMRMSERSYSLWAFMDTRRDKLINPLYYAKRNNKLGGCDDVKDAPITLDTSPHLIKYWSSFYNRFETGLHPRESVEELVLSSYNHIRSLERHIKFLKKKITEQESLHQKLSSQEKTEIISPCNDTPVPLEETNNPLAPCNFATTAILTETTDDPLCKHKAAIAPSLTTEKSLEQMEFLTIKDKSTAAKLSDSSRGSSSFDSIDYPLKVVKECMQRLESKAKYEQEQLEKERSSFDPLGVIQSQNNKIDVQSFESETTSNSSQELRSKLRLDDLKVAYKPDPLSIMPTKSSISELSATTDGGKNLKFDLNQLLRDIDSVALNWQSARNPFLTECPCGLPFDLFAPKNHCYCCGKIFCARCTDRKLNLPGLATSNYDVTTDTSESDGSSDVFESPTSTLLGSSGQTGADGYIDPSYLFEVPVCRLCYKLILEKDSITSPFVESTD